MSGVLPLLVVYLSEVAGADASFALDEARKEERRRQKKVSTEGTDAFPAPPERAREARKLSQEQAIDALLTFYASNPNATHRQAGAACGRSRSWVSDQLRQLERAGRISRNGDGVQVLALAQD